MQKNKNLRQLKVLVGTPHADVKNYCLPKYFNSVKNLSYKNHNLLVVDNSNSNKNKKMFVKNGVHAIHIKRKNKTTRQLIADSSEYLRNAALNGGYDFLLHYESDIDLCVDIIERLLMHQKLVVSANYFIGQKDNSHLMVQEIEPHEYGIRDTINITNGVDAKYMNGKLHEVYACGLGCTLIHRSVLEKIKFRYESDIDAHPDTFFAEDLTKLGIKQYLDGSILLDHDNMDWNLIENK